MKLFIHDKFFDAFAKLPKTIQGRTRDLMKKFRDNSTSNAINYEKISTFKDPQLRTVRVNDTYRAIVHAPKTGDHYHLLWVDHHDKAMDWAKHKVFEWNRETQAYQVYELQEKASPTIKEEENREETVVSIYSDKQLLRIGVPEILLGSVKEINSFDDLEKWEKYLPQDVFENLFYLLDGLDINNLVRDVEEGKNKVVPETSINNQRHFYLVTDDEALEEVLSDDFVKWQIFLHPSQYAVAYGDFKGATKVTGGAGTGKTVAALHRAKHLSENELFPIEKPILFTTYTKALTSGLKKSFGALNIDSRKVKLQNIHAYAVEFAKEQGLIPLNAKILDFLDTDQRREI
ncbi:MAG: UvrD-helicase domain-containing protein, partial [Chitinophagales bacterium]